MKFYITILFLFSIQCMALEVADPDQKPVKEVEKKVKKKVRKRYKGKFFSMLGVRPPVNDVYGGNLELGYYLFKGSYRTYLTILIEHFEVDRDKVSGAQNSNKHVGAAQLGFKAGMAYPIGSRQSFGLAPFVNIGSMKTSVQNDPWLGDRDNALSLKSIYFAEVGTYFFYDAYMLGIHARYSNSIISNFDPFLSVGLSY